MEVRTLGGSGFKVPVLSLGTGTFGGRGEFFKAWGGSGVDEATRLALMPLAIDQKVGTVVWSPLGWGRLTGKVRRNQPLPATSRLHVTASKGPPVAEEYLYRVVDAIDEIAKETGKNVPQIAINWLLQRPTVSNVIIGARDEEQLRQNLGAVGWNLSAEQVARLDAASATTPAYPYWHQRHEFADRNPPPV